jgi:acetylornithine deacetylase
VNKVEVYPAIPAITPEHVIEIAKRLCRVKQPGGCEGALAHEIAVLLEHPRIEVHVDPVVPGRPNVIARVRGKGLGPDLLLNGHLDAGYAPNWSRDPHDPWVESGRLYGAGVSDMLGGVASMIAAIQAAARGEPLPGDLVLLANMHHDTNGLGTKYALATGDEWPRFAVNGEPTSSSILTAHGGCIKFEILLHGRAAHISRLEESIDALAAAADTCVALRSFTFRHDAHPRLPGLPKLLLGELHAGDFPALVAHEATLRADLRTVPGMSWRVVEEDLKHLLEKVCPPEVPREVHCLVRQRPFVGNWTGSLMDALRAAHLDVYGKEPEVDVDRAAQKFVTDAADLAAATHDVELTPRPETIVHLDVAHRGLGTASCGPDTLPEYLVPSGTYQWSWTLTPLEPA